MKKNILTILTAVLLIFIASSCQRQTDTVNANAVNNKKIPNVSVETVATREMVEKIVLPGLVNPDQEVVISAEVGGILERIGPEKGDRVKKGEILAEINSRQLKAVIEQALALVRQARLAKDEAELDLKRSSTLVENAERQLEQAHLSLKQDERVHEKTEIALNNQRKRFERIKKLFDEKLATQAAFDDAESLTRSMEADLESSEAGIKGSSEAIRIAEGNLLSARLQNESAHLRIDTAQAQIDTREAALTQARLEHEKSILSPPFDSYVDDIFFEEGEFVKAESAVMKLIKFDPVKVIISLPEKDIPFIRSGEKAVITISSLPGETFTGNISFVALSSDTRTNTYKVEIYVANTQGIIKPGMVSQVTIVRRKASETVSVPNFAVIQKEEGEVVFILQDDLAVMRKVKTGIVENGQVQITEGLVPGEKLIIKGQRDLEDGQEVKVL